MSQRGRNAIYAPGTDRHDQRRRARGRIGGQYDLGVRFLLRLHHPLPPEHSHYRCHLHTQAALHRRGRHQNTDAPALAKTFTNFVNKYGRSFEFGLATGYHLLRRPVSMMKMGPMGLQMFARRRMALRPTRIRQLSQLQAIIKKAKELSAK